MAFERFEVIPAVDVQEGAVVQLVQGERGTEKRYGEPVEAARRWVDAGAETLHLVDLDGAFEGERRNAPAVAAILDEVDVDVQLGGGIRTAEDAVALLDRGVDRVILGTAAVETPEIVAEIDDRHPGSVMVSLDAREGEVVVSGWTEATGLDPAEAAARYADLGAGAILFTDVDVEGRRAGVRTEVVGRMVDAVDVPVVASGGVATVDDVRALRAAGAAGVVVGTALYEGAFTLADAQAAATAGTGEDALADRTFARRNDDGPARFVYVTEEFETDGTRLLRCWTYDRSGFLGIEERERAWLDDARAAGEWREIDRLPERLLDRVSGDEVPNDWTG